MSQPAERPPCPPEYTPHEWAEYHRDPGAWCIKGLGHTDAHVRFNAADILRGLADAAVPAIPALATGCSDPNDPVRAQCVFALLEIAKNVGEEAAGAVPALLGALSDPNTEVRQLAANALRWSGDARAVPALVGALGDPEVRQLAAKALGAIGGPVAVPALRQLLADPEPKTRETAAAALARMSPSQ